MLPQWALEIIRPITLILSRVFWRVRWRNKEYIPASGGVIIAANHQTYLDPFWIASQVKRPVRFLAWDAAFNWPVVGYFLRLRRRLALTVGGQRSRADSPIDSMGQRRRRRRNLSRRRSRKCGRHNAQVQTRRRAHGDGSRRADSARDYSRRRASVAVRPSFPTTRARRDHLPSLVCRSIRRTKIQRGHARRASDALQQIIESALDEKQLTAD